jgi:hypothetical protein
MAQPEREALARLEPGDPVTVRGPLVASCEGGIAVLAVNVLQCVLHTSTPAAPTPEAKCSSRGTRLATIDGVAEANARFAEKHGETCA